MLLVVGLRIQHNSIGLTFFRCVGKNVISYFGSLATLWCNYGQGVYKML